MKWTPEKIHALRVLYSEGWPRAYIAESTGRSEIAIKRAIDTFGLERQKISNIDPAMFDTEAEQWRPSVVPGYAVSSSGSVMSFICGQLGRRLHLWTDEWGYAHASLQVGGRAKRFTVHRLMALAFLGPPPSTTHQVAHWNGKPWDNRVENIRWATGAENQADRLRHGTATRGVGGRFVLSRLPLVL